MGAMKHIFTKIQSGVRLNKDERAFVKVFLSPLKSIKETNQLNLFSGLSSDGSQKLSSHSKA